MARVAKDLGLGLRASTKVDKVEAALRDFCDCLTVRGSTTSERHVNAARDEVVYRDAVRWADAGGRPKPSRPGSKAGWKGLRDELRDRLVSAEALLHARQVLKFWDKIDPQDRDRLVSRSGHIVDPTLIVDCSMHLTLRVVQHVLGLFYKVPLEATRPLDKAEITRRLDAATAAIRRATGSHSFIHRKQNGRDATPFSAGTKLRALAMPAHRAKRISRATLHLDEDDVIVGVEIEGGPTYSIDISTGKQSAGDEGLEDTSTTSLLERVATILFGDDPKLPTVRSMIEELTHVLKIINTCDWEGDTSTPAEFQEHADAFGKHLLAVWGDAAVTPYVHDIIAGHIYDQMMLWGPICRLSNEAAERKGGQGLVKRFLGHSQRGGCTGAKGSLAGKCDSVGPWCGRDAIRSSGHADEVIDADEKARDQKRRDKIAVRTDRGRAARAAAEALAAPAPTPMETDDAS